MPVSVGPESPTESNIGAPVGGISYWWRVIADWIKSLSPSGATQYDTDWVPITLASGFQTYGTAPAVRRVGKDIELRGLVQPNPAGDFAASTTITVAAAGGIPAGFRVGYQMLFPVCGNFATSVNGARLAVNPDGSLQLVTGPTSSPYFSLFGARYKVD